MWAESHISMYRHESIPLNQRHYSNDWTTIPPPKHPRQPPPTMPAPSTQAGHSPHPYGRRMRRPYNARPIRKTGQSPHLYGRRMRRPYNARPIRKTGHSPPPVRATHASPK